MRLVGCRTGEPLNYCRHYVCKQGHENPELAVEVGKAATSLEMLRRPSKQPRPLPSLIIV